MYDSSFLAARRAPTLVNRTTQLETVQRAIYRPEVSCNIVLIRGLGGMGKSRLSEEILWRSGNWRMRLDPKDGGRGPVPDTHTEWDWTKHGMAIVGDLIDMSAPRLHARAPFLHAIRDALVWPGNDINFTRYDTAYDKFQGQRFYMGDFQYIQKMEQDVESQFLNDYAKNAKLGRITLILDTVEKLYPMGGTELLLEEGLLTPEDMQFYTYQWLLRQIRQGGLPNTTLILVGRAEEGHAFFDAVTEAASSHADCRLIPMEEIGPFSLVDTVAYFQSLVETGQGDDQEVYIDVIKNIAEDKDRIETLWIYTGGQPVRLALYTDLIVEDQTIPERLQESPQKAKESQGEIKEAQKEIEAGFIRLLFGQPNLRAEILKALVRAPRGLDLEQLHYCLGSNPSEMPGEWLKRRDEDFQQHELSRQINDELKDLRKLAIVKIRPGERLGLQDEVYRIYTDALSKDGRGRAMEKEARLKLHSKLRDWAKYQFDQHLKELTVFQSNFERQLRFERPSLAAEIRFPTLPNKQQVEEAELRAAIQQWELEDLHYSLLQNFTYNFNNELFELADQKWTANDENSDAVIRAELWQLLQDPAYALQEFGNMTPWESLKRRGEDVLHAFKRFALQNDVSDWIKRFGLRKKYTRAIEFADQSEKTIQRLGKERAGDPDFRPDSWQNTLARSERALWRSHACVLAGIDIPDTLADMVARVADLEKLLSHSQTEMVFPDRGEGETGFLGHPAEIKTKRVAALYYNYMGYAYTGQGNFSKAIEAYGKALRFMRAVKFPHMEATTRNNLARVLSDRGHARGRRLCLDALEMRKEQGTEVPIAYSYNTLALIDNDHSRPDLAWIEAAIAVAYFRKAEDPRGLGLALLQLSEALRRLAKRKSETYHLRGDSPEVVLETAERIVNEAVDIFTKSGERLRRVEAWIEKACLERDLILFNEGYKQKERHYRDALYYLEQATDLAREIENLRLELDSCVNIAWTYYHFQKFEFAEQVLEQAEKLLPEDSWFKEGGAPPPSERDDLHIYYQLSKMYGLRGRMALDQFINYRDEVKKAVTDKEKRKERLHQDQKAQHDLQRAAETYVLALAYAQLLSPRSSLLTIIYDACYDRIKDFNLTELEDFLTFTEGASRKYGVSQIRLADFGNLSEFLSYTFGIQHQGT